MDLRSVHDRINWRKIKRVDQNPRSKFSKTLVRPRQYCSLFQNCIEYIERLEKQLADYNSRKRFGKLRCNAIEDEKHCENIAVKRVFYRGILKSIRNMAFQRLFLSFYVKSITIKNERENN